MTAVFPPELEAWLCAYGRQAITGVMFDNKEPPKLALPLAKPLVVIRDDSGSRLSHVTFDRSIGISVLAGNRLNDKPANDLARQVAAVFMDEAIIAAPGSPIASIEWDGCSGPYPVADDLDVARRYLTVQYTAVGSW